MVPLVRTDVITFESGREEVSREDDFIKQPADAIGAFFDEEGEAPPRSAPNEPPNTLLDFVACIFRVDDEFYFNFDFYIKGSITSLR